MIQLFHIGMDFLKSLPLVLKVKSMNYHDDIKWVNNKMMETPEN